MHAYRWDFTFLYQNYPLLLDGLLATFKLAIAINVLAVLIGLVAGAARASRHAAFRVPATAYVEFFRNIPALVQVFWVFYALPILTNVQINAFVASVLALSLYNGAYLAEIFRSGIQSIERGQWEAGKALGLSYLDQMRFVVLPQAVRRIIPSLTNQAIEIVKFTTVASTISFAETLYYAKLLSEQEFRPLESYTAAAALLVTVILAMSYLARRLEMRLELSD